MKWFSNNLERSMHKELIMCSKLNISKRNNSNINTEGQSKFETEITDLYEFFEKRHNYGWPVYSSVNSERQIMRS